MITIFDIQRAASAHFGITMDQLLSDRRSKEFVIPRMIAIKLSLEMTTASTVKVGRMFNRDHTTVMHARDRIAKLIKSDAAIEFHYLSIKADLDMLGMGGSGKG